MKYLFIAEKPSLMRDVQACYKNHKNEVTERVGEIDFTALSGHVCTNFMPTDYEEWKDKSWKAILDERLFIDCHKSYIVNMKSIVTIDKDILLKNGTRIPISRRKKNDVLQAYIKFDTHYNRI